MKKRFWYQDCNCLLHLDIWNQLKIACIIKMTVEIFYWDICRKSKIGSSNNSLFLIWFHNRNLANCCSCCCSSGNSNYTSRLCVPLTTTIVVVVVNIGLQWFQRACHRRQQHCCCWCCCCCRPGQLQVLLVISFTAAMVVVMNKDITSLVRAIYNLKCCCGCILQALCVPSATSIFVVVVVVHARVEKERNRNELFQSPGNYSSSLMNLNSQPIGIKLNFIIIQEPIEKFSSKRGDWNCKNQLTKVLIEFWRLKIIKIFSISYEGFSIFSLFKLQKSRNFLRNSSFNT